MSKNKIGGSSCQCHPQQFVLMRVSFWSFYLLCVAAEDWVSMVEEIPNQSSRQTTPLGVHIESTEMPGTALQPILYVEWRCYFLPPACSIPVSIRILKMPYDMSSEHQISFKQPIFVGKLLLAVAKSCLLNREKCLNRVFGHLRTFFTEARDCSQMSGLLSMRNGPFGSSL